ncbi:MAG: acyl-CoA thioesterase [Anaerolineae bacterium]|nr:acyl-CoA thioesterase [Anaerolineae bacterium]
MTSMTPPDGFRHHIAMPVRWSDLDALGHVNNAVYLTYFEQARISYFNALALWDGSVNKLGLIMARAVIDYKLPLNASDDVHVFTRTKRLGTKSFDTEQAIVRRVDDQWQVAATGLITIVVFDYQTNQSAPMPAAWREMLTAYEPAPIQT